jgi:hypothetical protein
MSQFICGRAALTPAMMNAHTQAAAIQQYFKNESLLFCKKEAKNSCPPASEQKFFGPFW